MSTRVDPMQKTVIAGRRPTGSQSPDGTHRWATRTHEDGTWTITAFDGWLVDAETTTTDPDIAKLLTAHYTEAFAS